MTRDNVTHVLRHLRKLAGADAARDLSDGELLERFCRRREEAAFALLVQRHGAMVLGVCRRVVRDAHDAEDAFQATFLVLARKADAIRKQGSVASWLYGVARRVAAHARRRDARRLARERQSAFLPHPEPGDEPSWRELREGLDEELAGLPEKYRAPLVLCYFEGKTHDEAARELGCPRTSLSSRLTKARALLHGRLTRRGLALSTAALAVALTESAPAATLPALLTLTAVRAGMRTTTAGVEALAEGALAGLPTAKGKAVLSLLLGVGLLAALGVGVGVASRGSVAPAHGPDAAAAEAPPEFPPEEEGKRAIAAGARETSGVVVDAGGRPVAGATVWMTHYAMAGRGVEAIDRAVTDAEGRYRLTVSAEWLRTPHTWRQELGIVAHKPGMRLAALDFTRESVPPALGTRLVLAPAAEAAVQIVTPDGKPAAGARVEVTIVAADLVQTDVSEEYARQLASAYKWKPRKTPIGYVLRRASANLPEELVRRLSARTDERGTATFRDLTRADLGGISVATEAFGTQNISLNFYRPLPAEGAEPPLFPVPVALRPVGRVTGRLVAKGKADVKGITLSLGSMEDSSDAGGPELYHGGKADVVPDAEGRFEVRALAAGRLNVILHYPKETTSRGRVLGYDAVTVKAGASTTFEIPVENTVRLTGVVRERGTGKPLANVRVMVGGGYAMPDFVVTDAAGRYSGLALPGEEAVSAPVPPPGFLPLGRNELKTFFLKVPADKPVYEAPPIELTRLLTLRGSVVGEDGKPVPGAAVRAVWVGASQRFGFEDHWVNEKDLTTDERGDFRLDDLAAKDEVRLKARHKGARSAGVLVARAGADKPIQLRVSAGAGLALAGRARDAAGRPVAGAVVAVRAREWAPPPNLGSTRDIAFDGDATVRAGADGTFLTPRELDPDGEYQVVVTADGFQVEKSGWLPVGAARPLTFPDVVLKKVQALQGRVVDRQGKPVAGATLVLMDERNRLTARSDADGRFRLDGALDGPGFLFTDAAGFRFDGRLTPTGETADIVLARDDEPSGKSLKTLPPALTRKERAALAAGVLEPAVKKALGGGKEEENARALEALALIDPTQALEALDKRAIKSEWMRDYLRNALVKALAKESPDEARSVAEAMSEADFRASAYLELANALPSEKRDKKRELLAQALLNARAVKDPSHRIITVGMAARRFRELGETERGDKLLRDEIPTAQKLSTEGWSAYARGAFAEELAAVDLDAALALIKDTKDVMEYDRHHGNIAYRLAGTKPAEAERVLGLVGTTAADADRQRMFTTSADYWAARVCYHMATIDLPRARRIADRVTDPYRKAHAYGSLALALAKSKPKEAMAFLRQAFAVLAAHVDSGKDLYNGSWSAPVVALTLVPAAEAIDPSLAPEFLWRALSLRTHRPVNEMHPLHQEGEVAEVALLVSRYDRAMGRALLEPLARRAAEVHKAGFVRPFLPALALIDPKGGVALFEALPDDPRKVQDRPQLAKLLLLEGDERWREAQHQAGLWFVGDEDL